MPTRAGASEETEEAPPRQALPTARVLHRIAAGAQVDTACHLPQPGLARVRTSCIPTRTLVIGDVEVAGIVLRDPGAAMDPIRVPADEVGDVSKVVPGRARKAIWVSTSTMPMAWSMCRWLKMTAWIAV